MIESATVMSQIFSVDSVQNKVIRNNQAFVELQVGPKLYPISFKVDTGSQVNILPSALFNKLNVKTPLQVTKSTLTAYDGSILNTLGTVKLRCKHEENIIDLKFHVVKTRSQPILGLTSCIDLDIVRLVLSCNVQTADEDQTGSDMDRRLTKDSILKDYSSAFKGIGLLPGECTIHTDSNVQPVVHSPRRVPIALKNRVKQELDRMVQHDIM